MYERNKGCGSGYIWPVESIFHLMLVFYPVFKHKSFIYFIFICFVLGKEFPKFGLLPCHRRNSNQVTSCMALRLCDQCCHPPGDLFSTEGAYCIASREKYWPGFAIIASPSFPWGRWMLDAEAICSHLVYYLLRGCTGLKKQKWINSRIKIYNIYLHYTCPVPA